MRPTVERTRRRLTGFGYILRLTLISTVLLLLEFNSSLLSSDFGLRDTLSGMEKRNKRVTSLCAVNKNIQAGATSLMSFSSVLVFKGGWIDR